MQRVAGWLIIKTQNITRDVILKMYCSQMNIIPNAKVSRCSMISHYLKRVSSATGQLVASTRSIAIPFERRRLPYGRDDLRVSRVVVAPDARNFVQFRTALRGGHTTKAQDTAKIVYAPAAKSKLPTRTHVCAVLSASPGHPGPSRSIPRRDLYVKYAKNTVDSTSCSGTTVTSAVHAIVLPVDYPSIKVVRVRAPSVI